MAIEPQDVTIETGEGQKPSGSSPEPPPRRWKITIGTRDIALLLAFVLIVVGLATGNVDWKWGIGALVAIAAGEGVSQFLHHKKTG